MDAGPQDPYASLSYERLIDWPRRLAREAPLILRVLAEAPSRRVLDLGCGTGEHSRFLAAEGFDPTGLDASPAQVAAARAADPAGRYLQGSLTDLAALDLPPQGAALCLGNTLPHLLEAADLDACFRGLAARLAPGGRLLLQTLNYDRILDAGERTFPVALRPGDTPEETLVFLRTMTHHGEGRLTFVPSVLRLRPGGQPPLAVAAVREVPLRGWRRADIEARLAGAGFQVQAVWGGMAGEPWSPAAQDLVLAALAPEP